MAQKNPYFKFYASDWLGSTKRAMMTPALRGAYIDLLAHQWNDESCSLPDDDNLLAALSGLGEGWLKVGSTALRKCFPPHPTLEGRLANPRLLEIRFERDKFIAKSAAAGRKSQQVQAVRRIKVGSTNVATKREPPLQPNSQPNVKQPKPKPESKRKKTPTVSEKAKSDSDYTGEFDEWWLCYREERRTDKPKAFVEWKLAVRRLKASNMTADEARDFLCTKTTQFTASAVGQGDPKYLKHPHRWLKAEGYNEDPKTWEVSDGDKRTQRPLFDPSGQTYDPSQDPDADRGAD